MNKSQLLESLKAKGFSKQILEVFEKVKREDFISPTLKEKAYEDRPLPLGQEQTISQPYTIAVMLDLLKPRKNQKVLEIGSGCGYVLALLSEIVGSKGKVFGIEIVKELAEYSKDNLKAYKNVKIYNKNGFNGLPEQAPFDRILISAACEEIPNPLLNQLKEKGILVAPIGQYGVSQSLVVVKRQKNKFVKIDEIPGFAFVRFVEK